MPAFHANNRLNDISFNYDKILEVIESLDSNKAHGHDSISVTMLKVSCPSIIKPLLTIFWNRSKFKSFPDN